jgi:formylglycine-generating enzyme required for sulfatase activity
MARLPRPLFCRPMASTASRTAPFLLRQPRQVQGFREPLPAGVGRSKGREGDPGVELFDGLALTMIWIPPGRFWMGSPESEPKRQKGEGPQHLLQLPGFFMGQTPITQAQWRAVAPWPERSAEDWRRQLKPSPSRWADQPDSDRRPVEQVSWHEAMEFCSRLSQRTGRHYTLPSEAQWEYACRAGTTTAFHFGAMITPALANYDGNYSYADGPKGVYRQQTTPVGMFPANPWGLYDMHGNVWEWCLDHWHDSYEGAPTDGSAWLDAEGVKREAARLARGGSWDLFPWNCRSADRRHFQPNDAFDFLGLRVICLPHSPSP